MKTEKPTTGKYSHKKYRCTRCGHESMIGTNHWGPCYPFCKGCSWSHPMQPQSGHICLEAPPEGMGIPQPWVFAKLGDIAQITVGAR
jgi:hypothetical protein